MKGAWCIFCHKITIMVQMILKELNELWKIWFLRTLLNLCLNAQRCLPLYNPWTIACQVPLSMGFFRQECGRGLPISPPGPLSDPRIEPMSLLSPALQADSLPTESVGKPFLNLKVAQIYWTETASWSLGRDVCLNEICWHQCIKWKFRNILLFS